MTYNVYVCSIHGIISEREMEEAPEIGWTGGDMFGEPCEPFGCPCFDGGPVPCLKPLEHKTLIEKE